MALVTVGDYITRVRTLLQDAIAPYRYPDADLVDGLNAGITESRRLRPDMWFNLAPGKLPQYSASTETAIVAIDQIYGMAFCYYVVGLMQLRDAEDTQDPRALAFISKFSASLQATGS